MSYDVTEIDGVKVKSVHRASCHCGKVVMELALPNGLIDLRRCDCSLCRRRGAIAASVSLNDFKVVKGEDNLQLYQFNTKTAKHYFCRICGVYTHHQRRSSPNQYGFDVACLEGINPLKLSDVPVYDGIDHPADRIT